MFTSISKRQKHTTAVILIALALAVAMLTSFANPAYAEHQDFVGEEPPVCDILDFDDSLKGRIYGNSPTASSEIKARFDQFGCRITGEISIASANFTGSGPFYGIVDGNTLRFTVTSETSDSPRDLNFSGLIDGDRISGQYSIPHTRVVSDWVLFISDDGIGDRLTDFADQASDLQFVAKIRELQARLTELLHEESQLTIELEHQVEIESEEVIHRWERAIEDLKAEVEHEIDFETRRIELEKKEVTSRLGRNTVVGELDRELKIIIAQKWQFFDEDVALKKTYMNEELDNLERDKQSQLDRFAGVVDSVEFELEQVFERSGFEPDQVDARIQDEQRVTLSNNDSDFSDFQGGQDESPTDSAIGANQSFDQPSNSEPKSERGFFFNSETGALGDVGDSLDPTTLAVIGILITLTATAIQLVKGN